MLSPPFSSSSAASTGVSSPSPGFPLVAWICGGLEFGETNAASRVVYGLVGLAAVYGIGSLLTASRRSGMRAAPAGAR
jgi:uncharacterized membrane protein YuzA (DUF378 family)